MPRNAVPWEKRWQRSNTTRHLQDVAASARYREAGHGPPAPPKIDIRRYRSLWPQRDRRLQQVLRRAHAGRT